jgi:hypothetical protein
MALSTPPEEDARSADLSGDTASPFALQDEPRPNPTPVQEADLLDGVAAQRIVQRLDRLEVALVDLETHLADRIAQRLRHEPLPPRPEPVPVPVAEIAAGTPPQAPRVEREAEPESRVEANRRRGWLWWEILRDGGRTLYMLIDSRYRMSWTTRIVVIGLLAIILLPQWWNPLHLILGFVPFVQEIVDKAVVVVLCFFLYKVLSRELLRYKDFLDDRARRRGS